MYDKWIVDIGANNGDDTRTYLDLGYKVISIEPNPDMFEEYILSRFSSEIINGNVLPFNLAISDDSGSLPFYINTAYPNWSSLNKNFATKNNMYECKIVEVPTMSLAKIVGEVKNIKYIKSDAEGADLVVITQLKDLWELPEYFSVEDCSFGFTYIEKLSEIGYSLFTLVDQSKVNKGTSGPPPFTFQDKEWYNLDNFLLLYENIVRKRTDLKRLSASDIWWDIHCRRNI